MKNLSNSIEEYIGFNRSLGRKMKQDASYLRNFSAFMCAKKKQSISEDLAVEWATLPKSVQPHTWTVRLATIRRFARFRLMQDRKTQIPENNRLNSKYRRRHPHIYSDTEVQLLLAAALKPHRPFWGINSLTLYTAVGLAATTGIRRSEILGLNNEDVFLREGLLKIERTKFNKSRLVPIDKTVATVLAKYAAFRQSVKLQSNSFFITKRGLRVPDSTINFAFVAAASQAGLQNARLHDLRHTFAVKTLIGWLHANESVDHRIHALTTYLGHTNPSSTYWYFSCVPKLMELSRDRMIAMEGSSL